MKKPIAIIGVSFQLPGIKDWETLTAAVQGHATHISSLPPIREQDIFDRFGPLAMAKGAFLERIDLFDHEYFGVKEREALKMNPEHRLFMTHALRAFYDGGYSESILKGSNTGVFFTAAESVYPNYLKGHRDWLDSLTGLEGTRLANFLDLRGPVVSMNTTCSSSLIAVHNACASLKLGECDMVLVGGAKFSTITQETANNAVVISNEGQCRPFDASADGMVGGEGVICMVLKRLEDALSQDDPIYGVIDGSAANHGGARISSLTAPSPEAQKEVVLRAWENAEINPEDLKFIEAHGTGTILGDPIEFNGLSQAFKTRGIAQHSCSISSFKGQVGHLDTMSGMAGLLRLLAAINSKCIPPQPNFKKPNSHINEHESAVKIQREAAAWPSKNGMRYAGVSSFGLTGTNVHIVVSQTEQTSNAAGITKPYFIQLGAKTKERLAGFKAYLAQFISAHPDLALGALAHKVNRLFNNETHRESFIFTNIVELKQQLDNVGSTNEQPVAFLLMDLGLVNYNIKDVKATFEENNLIKARWQRLIPQYSSPGAIENPVVANLLFQYVVYEYLLDMLGEKISVVKKKGGSALQNLLSKDWLPQTLIEKPELIKENTVFFNRDGFNEYLSTEYAGKKVVAIDFSRDSENHGYPANVNIEHIGGDMSDMSRYKLYQVLLLDGKNPLAPPNSGHQLGGISLPYLKFKRFWPENERPNINVPETETIPQNQNTKLDLASIQTEVRAVWKVILEHEATIGLEDNFFDLGGSSLSGLDMITVLKEKFGDIDISYEEMFAFPTVTELSQALWERLNRKEPVNDKQPLRLISPIKLANERQAEYDRLVTEIQQGSKPQRVRHQDILVTGATGLIGTAMVKELLVGTDMNVFCMVRGETQTDAQRRFDQVFQKAYPYIDHSRAKVIKSDMEIPGLGIGQAASELLEKVDTVFHLAGSPAFVGNPALKNNVNYVGTKNIFDWAEVHGVKHFNYCSTIGVVGNGMPSGIDSFYETDIDLGQDTNGLIHAGSKLLAESFLRDKDTRVKVKVLRMPNMGGRLEDGYFQSDMEKNLMYMKLQAIAKIGAYSESFLNYNPNFNLMPVDFACQTIYQLSMHEIPWLDTYHLGFEKGFLITDIVQAFAENGLVMQNILDKELTKRVEKLQETTNEYFLSMYKHGTYDKPNNFNFSSKATVEILKKINIDINYNRLKYLCGIVKNCVEIGFLSPDCSLEHLYEGSNGIEPISN